MNAARRLTTLALLLLSAPVSTSAASQAQLIEIRSSPCIACDAMSQQLRGDPRWAALSARISVRTLDRDQAEAADLLKQHPVGRLPSWLLLNAEGEEMGRVAGAVSADAFHARISQLLAQRTTLKARRYRATDTTAEGAAATAEALESFHAQGLGDAGFAWWMRLPLAVRGQHTGTVAVQRWRNRIEFLQAAQRGQPVESDIGGQKVLADPALGCDRGLELDRYVASTIGLPAETRRNHLQAQLPAMQAELTRGWFSEAPACVDGASLLLATADLYAALDDAPAERALLKRATADTERRLAGKPLSSDPALAGLQTALQDRLNQLDTESHPGAAR